ncbi:MAG: DUF805 domain-containing protein [Prevotella sp.]|nr:DUF805 domain-containing protein [Prevotella sp.]
MEQNFKELPMLSFGEAVKKNLSSLTDFKGRSRRSELWWNYLLYIMVGIAANIILGAFPVVLAVAAIVIQIVLLAAVTIRRLHDRGQSGLWVVAAFIIGIVGQVLIQQSGFYEIASSLSPNPEKILEIVSRPEMIATWILSLIVNITIFVFCLLDSKPEANKYGPSPKYVIDGQE